VVSGVPQGGSQSCETPRNPLFGVFYVGKNIYLVRIAVEINFPYVVYVIYVIYAVAALAGDDSPGQQCTGMMSHVCVSQAYPCGVPNVVKNVRQIENEMDSHL